MIREIKDLNPRAHVHLMGICGTAMGSLAGLLKARGFHVTGSDQNIYPPMSTQLEHLNIPIMKGFKKENLNPKPDFVVVGNVISKKNEEAQALLSSQIPYSSLPQVMEDLILSDTQNIVVAGTHGKTTTTAMIAWIADQCGFKPGFLIGGVAKNFGNTFRLPQGPYFVIEGDEYDTAFFDKVPKFVHYKPKYTILSSIEYDHADIYPDLLAVKRAFSLLIEKMDPRGLMVTRAEDLNVREVARSFSNIVSFGWSDGDFRVGKWEPRDGSFEVLYSQKVEAKIKLNLIGRYNVLNALSAYALSKELGWDHKSVIKALETFQGVKRRQEIIGESHGILVIEDFAHHPTAVQLTIDAVKERYPEGTLFSIFEPRSATSRRKVFQEEYVHAFEKSDHVLISKPYDQSRIPESERFSSELLVRNLQSKKIKAVTVSDNNEIVKYIKQETKYGDIVLVMSNGGFDGLYNQLLSSL